MKTNCCVSYCHADSTRHMRLSYHAIPRDLKLRKRWVKSIRNDSLKLKSKGTTVCGLHFRGGRRTYLINVPTIFPWTSEWREVVEQYNSETLATGTTTSDHSYSTPGRCHLLTLNIPPSTTSANRTPWARRTLTYTATRQQQQLLPQRVSGLPLSQCSIRCK